MLCWRTVASNPWLPVRLTPLFSPEGQAIVKRDSKADELADS
jgi:hypothetical protein